MTQIKVKAGKYIIPITLEKDKENQLKLKFPFNRDLIEEIKSMAGARWHPEEKRWTIADNEHNWFQLNFLQSLANKEHPNPYDLYDRSTIEWQSGRGRKLFNHQVEGIKHVLTRKRSILAYDTGIGKTLIAIEVAEYLNPDRVVWVGPRSALIAVQYEFYKWRCPLKPLFLTYDGLKTYCKQLTDIPDILVFDECQKLKNATSQRSQAAAFLADKVRNRNGYIILMSGTPSPHSPLDWWHICEVACPGFLKEGDVKKFQKRLGCVTWEENNVTGGMYPKLVTWFDDPKKCKICGRLQADFVHDPAELVMIRSEDNQNHQFQPSKDEIRYLYERMKGLVLVRLKKDVLKELPDIVYREIQCEPSESILRMASLITKTSRSTIEVLTMMRELSDGFQYKESASDHKIVCKLCKGKKQICASLVGGKLEENIDCTNCGGSGEVNETIRETIEVPCPKDDVIKDLLEEYEDVGRVILYSSFTGGINRLVRIVKEAGWHYIRVDGRGWSGSMTDYKDSQGMLQIFQEDKELFPKVAFIANQGSGGIGLTLTASPVAIYFDNDFNFEYREQSKNRIHRPGMDMNKGAMIIDIVHLPVDRKVIENLEKKKDLQSMTLGELLQGTEATGARRYF